MPAVGALNTHGGPIVEHDCTASIVASPHGNVIIGAAHCMAGKSNMTFAPGYHDGKTPFGIWKTVGPSFVPDGWPGGDPNKGGSPYDVAFAVVEHQGGRSVQHATNAALNLRVNAHLPQNVTVVGYPWASIHKYRNEPWRGESTATAFERSWITLNCLGIPNGFSGGPWIIRGTHDVIGVIGGYGQNLPDTDPRNYSSLFTNHIKVAYDRAARA
jgi:hypothetical protein